MSARNPAEEWRDDLAVDHAERFVESLVLGEVADRVFAKECRRRGLRFEEALCAPLLFMASTVRGGLDARH